MLDTSRCIVVESRSNLIVCLAMIALTALFALDGAAAAAACPAAGSTTTLASATPSLVNCTNNVTSAKIIINTPNALLRNVYFTNAILQFDSGAAPLQSLAVIDSVFTGSATDCILEFGMLLDVGANITLHNNTFQYTPTANSMAILVFLGDISKRALITISNNTIRFSALAPVMHTFLSIKSAISANVSFVVSGNIVTASGAVDGNVAVFLVVLNRTANVSTNARIEAFENSVWASDLVCLTTNCGIPDVTVEAATSTNELQCSVIMALLPPPFDIVILRMNSIQWQSSKLRTALKITIFAMATTLPTESSTSIADNAILVSGANGGKLMYLYTSFLDALVYDQGSKGSLTINGNVARTMDLSGTALIASEVALHSPNVTIVWSLIIDSNILASLLNATAVANHYNQLVGAVIFENGIIFTVAAGGYVRISRNHITSNEGFEGPMTLTSAVCAYDVFFFNKLVLATDSTFLVSGNTMVAYVEYYGVPANALFAPRIFVTFELSTQENASVQITDNVIKMNAVNFQTRNVFVMYAILPKTTAVCVGTIEVRRNVVATLPTAPTTNITVFALRAPAGSAYVYSFSTVLVVTDNVVNSTSQEVFPTAVTVCTFSNVQLQALVTVSIQNNSIYVVTLGPTCVTLSALQLLNVLITVASGGEIRVSSNELTIAASPDNDPSLAAFDDLLNISFISKTASSTLCFNTAISLVQSNLATLSIQTGCSVVVDGNTVMMDSPDFPIVQLDASIVQLEKSATEIQGELLVSGNRMSINFAFNCRTWGTVLVTVLGRSTASVFIINIGGNLTSTRNNISMHVSDNLAVERPFANFSCWNGDATFVIRFAGWIFGVESSASSPVPAQLTFSGNTLAGLFEGRSFSISQVALVFLASSFTVASLGCSINVRDNALTHTTDRDLTLDAFTFRNSWGLPKISVCSNSLIFVSFQANTTAYGNDVNRPFLIIQRNAISVHTTKDAWESCSMVRVHLYTAPLIQILFAESNIMGLTVGKTTSLDGVAQVIGFEVVGTTSDILNITANEQMVAIHNFVFVTSQSSTSSPVSMLPLIAPVRIVGNETIIGNRTFTARVCPNHARASLSNGTSFTQHVSTPSQSAEYNAITPVVVALGCHSDTATLTASQTPSLQGVSPTPPSTFSPKTSRSFSLSKTASHSHSPSEPSPTPSASLPPSDTTSISSTATLSATKTATTTTTTTIVSQSTSNSTIVSQSTSCTSSVQHVCHDYIPLITLGAVLGVVNLSCSSALSVYPWPMLWIGSLLDAATNSSTNTEVVGAVSLLRSAMSISTTLCPIPPSPTSVPLTLPYSRWSSGGNVDFVVSGGGAGGVPWWAFADVINTTVSTLNRLIVVNAASVYTTGVGAAVTDPSAVVDVSFVRPNATTVATTRGLVLRLRYVGGSQTSGLLVTVKVQAELVLRCVGAEMLELTYILEASPPLTDTKAVADGVGVGSTVASGLTGSPSGVVRGGMLSSLSDLLRCEPVDLTAEQPLLSNMFNIALGARQGQYYRGGIVSGVIVLFSLSVLLGGIVVASTMLVLRREYASYKARLAEREAAFVVAPSWADAAQHAHLPGLMLVPMALVGEAFVPNGATLLSMNDAAVGDILLGGVALLAFAAYIGHLLWITLRVKTVEIRRAAHVKGERDNRIVRALTYWLHSPTLLVPTGLTDERWKSPTAQQYAELLSFVSVRRLLADESANVEVSDGVRWLLWFAPYADELNVRWFKVMELALGSIVNLVGGIVTDSCFLQGFCVMVAVGVLLVLLVVKRPLAVRAQQLTTTVVYGSMFASSVVVVANLFMQHTELEDVASVFFLVSTAFTVLQSVADGLISLHAAHTLFTAFLKRTALHPRVHNTTPGGEALHVPMIEIPRESADTREEEGNPMVVSATPPANLGATTRWRTTAMSAVRPS